MKGWVLGVSGIEREGDAHVGMVGPRWRTGPAGEDGPAWDQLGPMGWGRGEGSRPEGVGQALLGCLRPRARMKERSIFSSFLNFQSHFQMEF